MTTTTRNEKGRTLGRDMALFVLALFGVITFALGALLSTEARGQSNVNDLTPSTGSDVESSPIRTNFSTIKSELNTLFGKLPSSSGVNAVPSYSTSGGALRSSTDLYILPGSVPNLLANGYLLLNGGGSYVTLDVYGNGYSTIARYWRNSSERTMEVLDDRVVIDAESSDVGLSVVQSGSGDIANFLDDGNAGVIVYAGGATEIGANTGAQAALTASQLGSGTVMVETTSTTGDNPTRTTKQGRVATTNNTLTTVVTVPTATNSITYIKAMIVARVTGGAGGYANQGAAFEIHGAFDNVGGTVNELDTTAITEIALTDTGTGGYVVDLTQSGTNVLVQVQGGATDNVTWHATVEYMSVGS